MQYSYRSFFSFLLVAAVGVGLVGCDTLTEGNNVDPNQAREASPEVVLTSTQVATALFHEGNHARVASIWSKQLTGTDRQYVSLNTYQANASDFDNLWITGYADVIGDLQSVKDQTEESNKLVFGIAQVLEAYTFGTKAALHGSIPYSEARQGRDNLNPKFDDQTAVYEGVISTLQSAVSNLEAGGISPGSKDIYYGGSATSWKQLAWTLRARFQLHRGNYQAAFDAAKNGISSPANNMVTPHGSAQSVNSNPYWLFHDIERTGYLAATDSYVSSAFTDTTSSAFRVNSKTDESARFASYFTDGGTDLDTNDGADDDSDDATYFCQTCDYTQVSYQENELIKAEAALLKSSTDMSAALTALNNAREASDAAYAPGTDNYQPYMMSDFASGGIANQGESQANALLKEILEEKYVTLMGHIEAFNDLRRTDNFLEISPRGSQGFPQRFYVSQQELDSNDNRSETKDLFSETAVNESIDYNGVN